MFELGRDPREIFRENGLTNEDYMKYQHMHYTSIHRDHDGDFIVGRFEHFKSFDFYIPDDPLRKDWYYNRYYQLVAELIIDMKQDGEWL